MKSYLHIKKYQKLVTKLALIIGLILSVLLPQQADATHIVGGRLTYKHLGLNVYEFTLVVYRDCFNANPEAVFDDPASVGVFDVDGNLLPFVGLGGQLLFDVPPDDTIGGIVDLSCEFNPEPVCYDFVVYRDTFFIPEPRPGGYIFSYTRCCRNQTLTNIVDPLETGMTIAVVMTDLAYERGNTSPDIPDIPDVYICNDEPFCFDINSPDIDGDSVAYFLCDPIAGATSDNPMPQPPPSPNDIGPVTFGPGYDAENPFGNPDPGSTFIDPLTGEGCFEPIATGQYLVGLCVIEYSGGDLLSIYPRDYQFNVRNCGELPDASFAVDSVTCNELDVPFLSTGFGNEFQWYFDFDGDTTLQSDEQNPTFTYSDTGTYLVRLIATNSPDCKDTFEQQISITISGIVPQIGLESDDCQGDTININLIDLSTDSLGFGITQSDWIVYLEGDTLFLTGSPATISVVGKQEILIELQSFDAQGCSETVDTLIDVGPFDYISPGDTVISCVGDTNELLVGETDPDLEVFITWEPNDIILSPLTQNPAVIATDSVANYMLYFLVGSEFGCLFRDSVLVVSDVYPNVDFDYMRECGQRIVNFFNLSDTVDLTWDFGDGSPTSTERDPSHIYELFGIYTVTLSYDGNCPVVDTQTVNIDSFDSDFPDTVIACFGGPININPDPNFENTYIWEPEYVFSDDSAANPDIQTDTSITIFVTVLSPAADSCIFKDTIFVFVPEEFDLLAGPNDTSFCSPDSFNLFAQTTLETQLVWTNADGDTVGIGEEIGVVAGESPFYIVSATDEFGCEKMDTVEIIYDPIQIDFEIVGDPDLVCPNDTIKVVAVVTGLGDNYSFEWEQDSAIFSDLFNDTICVFVTEDIDLIVTVGNNDLNCVPVTDTFSLMISELDLEVTVAGDGGPAPICEFDTIKIVATVMGANPDDLIFVWDDHPSIISGQNDDTLCVFLSETTTYFVNVLDTVSGCEAMGSILLRQDAIEVNVVIDGPDLFCEGDTVKLIANVTNGAIGNLDFVWDPPGLIFGESNNDTVCAIVESDQEFNVTVTNELGCEGSGSTTVTVEQIDIEAIATTETGTDTIKQYMVVQLDVLGADPNWTFEWTGDLVSDPNIKNPTAEPLEDAIYIVKVTDDNGCMDIDTVQITVIEVLCEPPFVFIPNAFSPNGDNLNDVWMVRGLPIDEGYIVVYNRWGEKMWETNDVLNEFWDGTYRGEELNPDSYGYYMRILCIDGEEYEEKGNVTILR